MRYINISTLILPNGWQSRADAALLTLFTTTKAGRSKFIDSRQRITWKDVELVRALVGLVNPEMNKCWYSETKISDDLDVDHFRPKGCNPNLLFSNQFKDHLDNKFFALIDTEVNVGWWFLAFEYTNFRIAAPNRNQLRKDKFDPSIKAKGKSDFFPLKKGSSVAINRDGVQDEMNCLLDPCNPNDPEYLIFDSNGEINKTHPDTWIECRINVSIVVYHLDERQLKYGRANVWKRVQEDIIDEMVKIFRNLAMVRATKRSEFDRFVRKFNDIYANKSKEFSAVAIDCIRYNQRTYPWLNSLFPNLTK